MNEYIYDKYYRPLVSTIDPVKETCGIFEGRLWVNTTTKNVWICTSSEKIDDSDYRKLQWFNLSGCYKGLNNARPCI